MVITKQDMQNIHAFLHPIISCEKAGEIIPEKKKEILARYKKDEAEHIKKYSRMQRMEMTGNQMSHLLPEERELIEALVEKHGKDYVEETYIYFLYEMLEEEFDIPEEHVILMIATLYGAIWWVHKAAMKDEISLLLRGSPKP